LEAIKKLAGVVEQLPRAIEECKISYTSLKNLNSAINTLK
jgi:hypothetical protein